MSENQQPEDDRREPTEYEYSVGKTPITEGDKAQLREALLAMQRLQKSTSIEPSRPADAARAALHEAQTRKPTAGRPQSDNPALRAGEHYRKAGVKGAAEARRALKGEPESQQDPE